MDVDLATDSATAMLPTFQRINAVTLRTRELQRLQINLAANKDPQEAQGPLRFSSDQTHRRSPMS
eukprot:378357-Lingulodinium_polyedra.AAC.1